MVSFYLLGAVLLIMLLQQWSLIKKRGGGVHARSVVVLLHPEIPLSDIGIILQLSVKAATLVHLSL